MKSMLEEWRAEVARKPLAMSEADACQVLGLSPASDGRISEDDLKAAYRSLARKCACCLSPTPLSLRQGRADHVQQHAANRPAC